MLGKDGSDLRVDPSRLGGHPSRAVPLALAVLVVILLLAAGSVLPTAAAPVRGYDVTILSATLFGFFW